MKEVATKESIIEEVASRLDMDREKVTYVFNFVIGYFKKATKIRGIVNITIPFLGRMYLKAGKAKGEVMRLTRTQAKHPLSRREAIDLSIYTTKLEEIENNSQGGTSKLKHHWSKPKIKNNYLTGGKTLEELENWQNEEEK